ncbi:MAG: HNH endonuclease [Candidatus Tectomicrobia bacterium]|nr:HNH endonuclease [Candidatus Tectomicrobia bacterium]
MPEPERSTRRRDVERRAQGRCEYCQSPAKYSTQPFSLDHIIPRSQSGETSVENLALACQGCNNHKYNKTQSRDPVTDQLVDLFNPRQQRWQDHFTWNECFELIIGLTATGRVSVGVLKLNRPELVNLRRLLYAAGEHPLPETEDDE